MRFMYSATAIVFLFATLAGAASDTLPQGACRQSASCAGPTTPQKAGGGCGTSTAAPQKGEVPAPSCGAAVQSVPKGGSRLIGGGGSVEIPFELVNQHVVLPVSVNGSETFRLVLDTGMPFYGATLAPGPRTDALKLENPDGIAVMAVGMEECTPRVGTGVTLSLPGVEFTDQMVTVIPLPGSSSGKFALGSDGVIGLSVFDNYVVEIDYDNRVVTLTEPERFFYAGAGTEIPFRLGPVRMPEVVLTMETDDGAQMPVGLVVDTGAALPMTITLKPDGTISLPDGARDLVVGYSNWGEVHGKLARMPSLTLGNMKLEDVLITFFEQGAPGVPPCGENGLLGSEVLQRFVVTFDYANERMFLEPGRRFGEPFEFSTTGMSLRKTDDGAFEVVRVFPDTPASEAGVAEGDIVLSVDGAPSTGHTDDSMKEAMKTTAPALRLTLTRGGDRMDVVLKPRRLI